MADDDSLLDVFVRVLPREGDIEAIKDHLRETVTETTAAFNQLGRQASELALRRDLLKGQGRSTGQKQVSPEEQAAKDAQSRFADLRAQVGNDIASLNKQLNSLGAKRLLADLQGVREAFNEVRNTNISLVGSNREDVEIEQRIEQLLDLRRVLETIQQTAASDTGTPAPVTGNLRAALAQATALKTEIGIVNREVKTVTAPQLTEDLQNSRNELERLILEMRGLDDSGFTAESLQPYLGRLEKIRSTVMTIDAARQEASENERAANDQIFALEQERLRLQDRLRDFPPGVIPKKDRFDIQALNSALSESIRFMDVQKQAIDGTAESLARYAAAVQNVNKNQQFLAEKFNDIKAAGSSFNTLGNSAYQLGQAFEDAAIGYQLNGIAGAVRGASNNVSFLLMDMSRIPAVQTRIASLFNISRDAAQGVVGAVSGITAALAITVIGPMAEWLESLNDIDYGFTSLARRLEQEFSDIDLEIDVRLDETGFNRELEKLTSIKEVLEEIRKLSENSQDLTTRLQAQVADLGAGDVMRQFVADLDDVSERIREKLEQIRGDARARLNTANAFAADPLGGGLPGVPTPPTEAEITAQMQVSTAGGAGELAAIQTFIRSFNRDLDVLQENARQGIFDVQGIRNTRDLLERLTERFEAAKETLDPSDQNFVSEMDTDLQKVKKRIDALIKPARELESILNEQVASSIEAIGQKTEELAAKQAILRGQLVGTSTEYDEMVLDISEVSRQYESLIASTIEFYRSTGVAADRLKELQDSLTSEAAFEIENQILREQNDIVEKLTKAEERLADLRKKEQGRDSRKINLDRFTTAIQETALSLNETGLDKNTTAIEDLTEEIGRLQDALFKLNKAQEAVGQGGAANAIAGIALERTPRQMAPGVLAGAFGGIGGGLLAGLQQIQNPLAAMEAARLGAAGRQRALQEEDIANIGRRFAAEIRGVLKDQPIRIDKSWQPEIKAPTARLAN